MAKTKRQMIQVDEEKCDGCGQCIPGCPEGALQIVAGKARLVREGYCDGLGACLGECPNGALRVVELESDQYDEAGVISHLRQTAPEALDKHLAHLREHAPELARQAERVMAAGWAPAAGNRSDAANRQEPEACPTPARAAGCPPAEIHFGAPDALEAPAPAADAAGGRLPSELSQWPVQLRLLPVRAPFFQGADLTLVADCVPFANPNFHADVLKGTAVAVGCPKLDDAQVYVEKVTQILGANDIRSLKVVYMEVPCCRGLVWIAEQALARSGKQIPYESEMVRIGL